MLPMCGYSGLNTTYTRTQRLRKKQTAQRNRPAAQALQWLESDETGASVLARAKNLLAAEGVIRRALPPVLAYSCRVANIDRQCITVAVPGAAHATRLRQLMPTLLRALHSHGWHLTEMEIRVQAGLAGYLPPAPPREVLALDKQALRHFQDLQQNVEPGPLADAIERLLVHHGAKRG